MDQTTNPEPTFAQMLAAAGLLIEAHKQQIEMHKKGLSQAKDNLRTATKILTRIAKEAGRP